MNKFKIWLSSLTKKVNPPTRTPNTLTNWGVWGEVNDGRPAQMPMGVAQMTQFNPLTQSQIEQLKVYERLSKKDKSAIFEAIYNLEQMRANGQTPSEEDIFEQLSATGHLEIGLACYVAQLKKIKWR